MKAFLFSPLMVAILISQAARAQDAAWYTDSWVHAHVSLTLPPGEVGFLGEQIEAAGLDAVQVHTTGREDLWDAMRKARLDEKLNV
jgi:HD superfamily phosphohydrolase YqeK